MIPLILQSHLQCAVQQQPVDDEPDERHDDPPDVRPDDGADEDDGVEDEVGDGEVLGAVLHGEGAGAAAEVVQPDAHLGRMVVKKRANGRTLVSINVPWMDGMTLFVSNKCP